MTPALDPATLSRACDLADGMLSGVRQDQLTLATSCSEWVVRDLMDANRTSRRGSDPQRV